MQIAAGGCVIVNVVVERASSIILATTVLPHAAHIRLQAMRFQLPLGVCAVLEAKETEIYAPLVYYLKIRHIMVVFLFTVLHGVLN